MSSLLVIQKVSRDFQQAATEQDWAKVQHIDRQLNQWVTSLLKRTPTAEESKALKEIAQLYRKVHALCERNSEALKEKMTTHRQKQEGLNAYATFTPDETE